MKLNGVTALHTPALCSHHRPWRSTLGSSQATPHGPGRRPRPPSFVSFNSRLLNTVHALYAWVPLSPRVRCLLACFTYLLALESHALKCTRACCCSRGPPLLTRASSDSRRVERSSRSRRAISRWATRQRSPPMCLAHDRAGTCAFCSVACAALAARASLARAALALIAYCFS
jgi:hypothetical protein